MSYTPRETVYLLRRYGLKIKSGDTVFYNNIYKALTVFVKRHPHLRWVNFADRHVTITENGVQWLAEVYFANKGSVADNDIKFFEKKISEEISYCKNYSISYHIREMFKDDVTVKEFAKAVNRSERTIERVLYKQPPDVQRQMYYYKKRKYVERSAAIEICKNYFKKEYAQHLEKIYIDLRKAVKKNERA